MKIDKFQYESEWETWLEKSIRKFSNKAFKSGSKICIPKQMTINPNTNKKAFLMEDGSIVDCFQCILIS